MKKLIAAALAISMTLLCCACGKKADDSDLSYIQKKGALVVGITDYPDYGIGRICFFNSAIYIYWEPFQFSF